MSKERLSKLQKAVKRYAEKLIEIDKDIEEVVLIGSLVNGEFKETSDIDIVCLFDERLEIGTFENLAELNSRVNLLRGKLLRLQKALNIHHPIDIGFMVGSDIFLGGGLISNYFGKYKILVKNHEREKDSQSKGTA